MWRMVKRKLGVSCCLLSNEMLFYCVFHKHANSKVQKPPSQLRFSLPSIIITITSNEPWNTETHKTDRNPQITNHDLLNPWSKVLFPKRSVKMIDGSEKCNRQLAFELQNSHVCEKCSNTHQWSIFEVLWQKVFCSPALRSNTCTKCNLEILFPLTSFHQMLPYHKFLIKQKIKESYCM